ncbi:unnamed protein product [Malus baccata var. baccata]
MEQFREGRPLPAMLPSNVMFNLSNICQPANNYSNAGNVAWRPQTCFWLSTTATDAWSGSSAHGKPSWRKTTEASCSFSCWGKAAGQSAETQSTRIGETLVIRPSTEEVN